MTVLKFSNGSVNGPVIDFSIITTLTLLRSLIHSSIFVELDERFREQRNRAFISKWLRKTLRVYESFDLSLEGLKSFFEGAKVLVIFSPHLAAANNPSPCPRKQKKSEKGPFS